MADDLERLRRTLEALGLDAPTDPDELRDAKARILDSARSKADDAWLAGLLERLARPAASDEYFASTLDSVWADELRTLAQAQRPTREQLRLALYLLERLLMHDATAMLANELRAGAERESGDAQARQRGSAETKRAKRDADLDDLARALERLRQRKAVEDWDLDAIRAEANAERRKRKAPELGQSRAKNITHAAIAARADMLRRLRR